MAELIAVDMGALGEGLQGNEHAVSICAKDSGGPYDLGIRRRLVALAQAHDIPYKLDIYPFYGSDAEAALRAGGDYRIGLMGPGVDASHSFERTHRDALDASTRYCWLICSRSDGARGRTPALALARAPVQVSPGAEAGAYDCGFGWERAASMPVTNPDARALLYLRTYHLTGGAGPLMIRCRGSCPQEGSG